MPGSKLASRLLAFVIALLYVVAGTVYVFYLMGSQGYENKLLYDFFVPAIFFPLLFMFTGNGSIWMLLICQILLTVVLWLILWGLIALIRSLLARIP